MSESIIVALISGSATVVASMVAIHKIRELHLMINSRMDELLKEARELARLKGQAEEKALQLERERERDN